MERDEASRQRGRILWGLFLMALGGAFLLDRAGLVDLPVLWQLWPIVLVVIGIRHALARRPGSGAMFVLMAAAFFVAEFRWMGLSYRTFWPLLLVAVGVGIVIRAFSREDEGCADREACHD